MIRTKAPPKKISIQLWFHNAVDLLWVINGVVFIALLFSTGQWMRIVPTSWDVFPNAVSAALQYVSFDWPMENGWVNYNSLQQLSYFGVVFLLAPLAILTGLRMAEFWPAKARITRIYKIEWARAVHLPVMLLFCLFILVHVVLVLATGAQRNLNHMFAASDDASSWWGVGSSRAGCCSSRARFSPPSRSCCGPSGERSGRWAADPARQVGLELARPRAKPASRLIFR